MSENISTNKSITAKKKRKFNVVDFFIVVIILALIAILIYAFSPWSQIKKLWSSDEVSIEYTVELRQVDESYIDLINRNDDAKNAANGISLGEVATIESIEESLVLGYDSTTNEGVFAEHPNQYDITLRITAKADYEKGVGYSVNGCRIAVGEEIFFKFPKFVCSGYCIGLSENS